VYKVEPNRRVRMASRIGRLSPAHCSAVGKAMLTHLPDREVDGILQRHGLARMTAKTIVTPADLKAVRARGYTLKEEAEEDVRCVGAVVLGHYGRPLGAISISAPWFRLPLERVPALAASVWRAARPLRMRRGLQGSRIWFRKIKTICQSKRTLPRA
jgi:DNA-binding IclR family transcriptional regulator